MSSSHFALFIDEFAPLGAVEVDPGKVLAAMCALPDPQRKRVFRHRFPHLLVITVWSTTTGSWPRA